MALSVKVAGAWKPSKGGFVKVAGAWKPIKQIYTKINGVWKQTGGWGSATVATAVMCPAAIGDLYSYDFDLKTYVDVFAVAFFPNGERIRRDQYPADQWGVVPHGYYFDDAPHTHVSSVNNYANQSWQSFVGNENYIDVDTGARGGLWWANGNFVYSYWNIRSTPRDTGAMRDTTTTLWS
jgi:hypothetical protein